MNGWPWNNKHGWRVRESNQVVYVTVCVLHTSRPPTFSVDNVEKLAYPQKTVTRIDMVIGNRPDNPPYKHGLEMQIVSESTQQPSPGPRSLASRGTYYRIENYIPLEIALDQWYAAALQIRAFDHEYDDWVKQDRPQREVKVIDRNTPIAAILE